MKKNNIARQVVQLKDMLRACTLCPRCCGVNRHKGEQGFCRATDELKISSATIHTGEEPPISGTHGSGTIFLTHCTLRCAFCQNYPISQLGHGKKVTMRAFVDTLLSLQKKGAHNINFGTPTHYSAQIAEAVMIARGEGLAIPIVYNTSGYERVEVIELLDGIVDVYLPDAKYSDDTLALTYSAAPDYTRINQDAIRAMYKQKGNLVCDAQGIAQRGIIVRHLMLPGDIENTKGVLAFLARVSNNMHISFMSQYHPAHEYAKHPSLKRMVTQREYMRGLALLEQYGLEQGWKQIQ